MGQAKLRKTEIQALKALGPNNPNKIYSIGAYYKDLDDDGVSINLSPVLGCPKDFIKLIYQQSKLCVDLESQEFANGNYDYFHGANNREEAIQNLWNQLKFCIKEFNKVVFKSEVRPMKHRYQIQVNEDFITYALPIITNIWHLQNLGEIVSDNYNGMSFAYSN